jgi:hypothetical protein
MLIQRNRPLSNTPRPSTGSRLTSADAIRETVTTNLDRFGPDGVGNCGYIGLSTCKR